MPVLAIFTGQGINKGLYETLRKEINWERNIPKGIILHAASFDDSGNAHVADIWQSSEALNDFVNSRLMPAMKKHNVPAPKVEVYPTHNINAYQGIDQHKLK